MEVLCTCAISWSFGPERVMPVLVCVVVRQTSTGKHIGNATDWTSTVNSNYSVTNLGHDIWLTETVCGASYQFNATGE